MIDKLCERLESLPATVISGIFLLLDLVPHIAEEFFVREINLFVHFEFSWIAVLISGIPIVCSAFKKLIFNKGIGKISSALLISIAMLAAIAIGDLFAAAEVAFIMALGELLEDKTTAKAKKGIKKLVGLIPQTARKIVSDKELFVPVSDIMIGDTVRILPGETVAVDGQIINGETCVDQSVITGEALPVDKAVGDEIYSGTINCFGAVDVIVKKTGKNSYMQKLISMMKEAEDKKAPIQRVADKWASYLVPVALLLSVLSGIILQNVVVAVTVLVVFCPCALVLATPTAVMAAIGQATKFGVIIKSGEALEKMSKINFAAFDKTGTLTQGRLEVSQIISFDENIDGDLLLCLTASAESLSEHPLGKAITDFAKKQGKSLFKADSFKMESGKGIFAVVNGVELHCGNERYLRENNIVISDEAFAALSHLWSEGKASVLVAVNGRPSGIIALSDSLRSNAAEAVKQLKEAGVKSVLLTGDKYRAADYFARKSGVSEIFAELLPREKAEHIKILQQQGNSVCMVGDGINDAPALKTADVGIAMGKMGSDITVETADIVLIADDISSLPYLKRLANATVKTIKFSIFLSLFINFIAIVLSLLQVLTPITGALVHNVGSFLVVFSAALLYDRKVV
ncbi:MAG: cation-translocating P-type ATPase [Clostridia bacterium]|nr:cation-translocating P-type ATPase [Clostridia bacterium]